MRSRKSDGRTTATAIAVAVFYVVMEIYEIKIKLLIIFLYEIKMLTKRKEYITINENKFSKTKGKRFDCKNRVQNQYQEVIKNESSYIDYNADAS